MYGHTARRILPKLCTVKNNPVFFGLPCILYIYGSYDLEVW